MKKIILTAFAFLAMTMAQLPTNQAFADNIGETDAKVVATHFMQQILNNNEFDIDQVELVYTFGNTLDPLSGLTATYVYNVDDRAWVAVAGNDYVHPIVAFSEGGPYTPEAMAPALVWNLEVSAMNIAALQLNPKDYQPDAKTIKIWNDLRNGPNMASRNKRGTKAPMILLNNVCWEQGDPVRPTYNKFCPVVTTPKYTRRTVMVTDTVYTYDTIYDTIDFVLDTVFVTPDSDSVARIDTLYNITATPDTLNPHINIHRTNVYLTDTSYVDSTCYVGCVATAMSQIMYYWKYPINPRGRVSTTNPGNMSVPDIVWLDTVLYDYSKMVNYIDRSTTEQQINEIAKLCHTAGVAVGMMYGTDGSGAYSMNVPSTLINSFKYSTGIQLIYRDNTTLDNYLSHLRGDIQARHPVYMGGASSTNGGRDAAGHAWVCDGIRDDVDMLPNATDYYHMNWGWGCGSNQSWNNVRTNSMKIHAYNFNLRQEIICGIIPPQDSILSISTTSTNVLPSPAYPNPATSSVNIPYTVKQTSTLSVYTIDGRLVDELTIKPESKVAVLSTANYQKGVYIYRIDGSAGRFIVQ